jgi:hypothetical protein
MLEASFAYDKEFTDTTQHIFEPHVSDVSTLAQMHDVRLQAAGHLENAVRALSDNDEPIASADALTTDKSLLERAKKLKEDIVASATEVANAAAAHNKKAIDAVRRSSLGTTLGRAAEHAQKAYLKSKVEHAAQKAAAAAQAAADAHKAAKEAQERADKAAALHAEFMTAFAADTHTNEYFTNLHLIVVP